jgi:hypothetical protein
MEKKLYASDGVNSISFGLSTSLYTDTLIIGDWWGTGNSPESGSAYIFERHQGGENNWGEVAKLYAPDGAQYDHFGQSVSISGDIAVVGAFGANGNVPESGAAYVFARDQGGPDTWGLVVKLTASDGVEGDDFGWSVSISGDTVIVGDYTNNTGDYNTGAAYVFARDQGGIDNWGQVAKLVASDGYNFDQFGDSVSISGDTVVVGATQPLFGPGAAYVFARDHGGVNNWGQVTKLVAADGSPEDYFGRSVAVYDNRVVVGSPADDCGTGAAYVFERDYGGVDSWGQVVKLSASDAYEGEIFGLSVSISGDKVVIGAHNGDGNSPNSGAVYLFASDQGGEDNWGQVSKIFASDGVQDDYFYVVTISGETIVVGAHGDDSGEGFGSAYVYYPSAVQIYLPMIIQ